MPPATVAQYLASLPPDRREALEAVRKVILKNLDKDYEEGIQYGVIGYYVPHRVFPAGYHCDPKQPLGFAGLGSRKGYMTLALMSVYFSTDHRRWFTEAWARSGKKLDMGAACIRFKKLDDLPLDVIGEAVRRVPARTYVAHYENILTRNKPAAARAAAKKTTPKPAAKRSRTAPRRSAKAKA